ncbi:MAG: glycosyltransferase involved in cell wall biosynthesis [Roseivirga sp.]
MRLVANLIQLASGGGQRVGLNFVLSMKENRFFGNEVLFLVTKGSILEKEFIKNEIQHFAVRPTFLYRLKFELFDSKPLFRTFKPDGIYTVFGYSFFGKHYKQVSGVAYSNLFFPEIDFWIEYKGLSKVRRKLIDYYRAFGLKRASALIFENPAMEKRAHSLWSFSPDRTTYIPPSIHHTDTNKSFQSRNLNNNYNILMLCGWQRNKNIHLIPKIAAEAKSRQLKLHFTITVALDNSIDSHLFEKEMSYEGVGDMISLIGQVSPQKVPELYLKSDGIVLLSKLESFSNNIIEAWTYGVPLFITDHDWARNICGEAAFYVDRDDYVNIVDSIEKVILSEKLQLEYQVLADKTLRSYPSIDEKTKRELDFIKQIIDEK